MSIVINGMTFPFFECDYSHRINFFNKINFRLLRWIIPYLDHRHHQSTSP